MSFNIPRRYIWLYLGSLTLLLGVAAFQQSPGYMDAAYYFSGGLRLAEGAGFQDMLLWHFLDDPQGLPNPSHGYWMPLTSIIAFAGIKLFFFLPHFEAAQLIFVLLSAFIAPLTAAIAQYFTQDKEQAIFAGILAAGSGFYLPYLATTDAFSLYMLGGGVFFLLLLVRPAQLALGLGLVSGWMYLARADGVIWLMTSVGALILFQQEIPSRKMRNLAKQLGLLALGFGLIAGPWLFRNIFIYGALSAPGSGHSFWLVTYDDLFAYPAEVLTVSRWLAAGWPALWENFSFALKSNSQSFVVVQGGLVLFPFMLFGAWHLRKHFVARIGMFLWFTIFLIMTFVFPLAGARGGFFHSGAALMPLFWAFMAIGLQKVVPLLGRLPRWTELGAWRLVRSVSVGMLLLLSGMLLFQSLVKDTWGAGEQLYAEVDIRLNELGIAADEVVLVNNPPSYYAMTQRPAIVIPNGGVPALLAVADRYGVRYLLLEEGGVEGLTALYDNPVSTKRLLYLETIQSIHLFEVINE